MKRNKKIQFTFIIGATVLLLTFFSEAIVPAIALGGLGLWAGKLLFE